MCRREEEHRTQGLRVKQEKQPESSFFLLLQTVLCGSHNGNAVAEKTHSSHTRLNAEDDACSHYSTVG